MHSRSHVRQGNFLKLNASSKQCISPHNLWACNMNGILILRIVAKGIIAWQDTLCNNSIQEMTSKCHSVNIHHQSCIWSNGKMEHYMDVNASETIMKKISMQMWVTVKSWSIPSNIGNWCNFLFSQHASAISEVINNWEINPINQSNVDSIL